MSGLEVGGICESDGSGCCIPVRSIPIARETGRSNWRTSIHVSTDSPASIDVCATIVLSLIKEPAN